MEPKKVVVRYQFEFKGKGSCKATLPKRGGYQPSEFRWFTFEVGRTRDGRLGLFVKWQDGVEYSVPLTGKVTEVKVDRGLKKACRQYFAMLEARHVEV